MKDKATPRPWTVEPSDDPEWRLIMAGGKAGRIVANVNAQSCPDWTSAPAFVCMPADANAELIVRAVNAHDTLVEACRLGLTLSKANLSEMIAQGESEDGANIQAERMNIATFKAAIAKASPTQ